MIQSIKELLSENHRSLKKKTIIVSAAAPALAPAPATGTATTAIKKQRLRTKHWKNKTKKKKKKKKTKNNNKNISGKERGREGVKEKDKENGITLFALYCAVRRPHVIIILVAYSFFSLLRFCFFLFLLFFVSFHSKWIKISSCDNWSYVCCA